MFKELITYLYRSMIKSPEELGKISLSRVNEILAPICSKVFLSDEEYSVTSMEKALCFSRESMIQTDKYVAIIHDCDNYSYALNGYWSDSLVSFCFGIAWSNNHAFNIMIDDKKNIWIIEPQTNKYIPFEEAKLNKQYFPIRLILI